MNVPDMADRGHFMNMAAVLEGGLVVVAVALGWLADINPFSELRWEWVAVGWGTLAAVPLLLLFCVFYVLPFGPFQRIKDLLQVILGQSLAVCRWYDLLLLALLAGFSEEILFRGLLQPWIEGPHKRVLLALILSNFLFGLAHLVTPTYGIIAMVIGIYLGWTLDATGERNLLIPVTTHAVYDFIALLVIARFSSPLADAAAEERKAGVDN